jgi:outer membrane protein TolC
MLGCAAPKPEFINPAGTPPPDWQTILPTLALQDASRYPWWQALGSNELDALVAQALNQNTSIARAENAVRLANAQLKTVKLGWLPSLNIFGGRITGNTTLFFQGLPVPVADVGGFVGILPNYFVNLFRLPYEQRQAMEMVDVARAEMLGARLTIAGEVVKAYAVVVAAEQELAQLRRLKSRLLRQQRLLSDLVSVGMASQITVNQTAAQAASVDGQMALATANATAARNALNTLVKSNISDQPTLNDGKSLTIANAVAQQAPAAVLNTRPDILAERARVLATTTGIDVQTMLLAPTLDLNALRTNISVQADGSGNSTNANFTAGYATLVLDPRVFGLIETSQLQARAALLQYVQTVDQAFKQTEDALSEMQSAQLNLAALKRQNRLLNQNVKNLRAMQQAELTSELAVLDAEIEAILSRMSVMQAGTQATLAYVNLQEAMGIGVLHGVENLRLNDGQIETQAHEKIH